MEYKLNLYITCVLYFAVAILYSEAATTVDPEDFSSNGDDFDFSPAVDHDDKITREPSNIGGDARKEHEKTNNKIINGNINNKETADSDYNDSYVVVNQTSVEAALLDETSPTNNEESQVQFEEKHFEEHRKRDALDESPKSHFDVFANLLYPDHIHAGHNDDDNTNIPHYLDGHHNPKFHDTHQHMIIHENEFKIMDKNKDGFLDSHEVSGSIFDDIVRNADLNSDTKVNMEEFLSAVRIEHERVYKNAYFEDIVYEFPHGLPQSDDFKRIDINNDSLLTMEEILGVKRHVLHTSDDDYGIQLQQRFLQADRDKSKSLSLYELDYYIETKEVINHPGFEHKFDNKHPNIPDFIAGLPKASLFDTLDYNKNDRLEKEELSRYFLSVDHIKQSEIDEVMTSFRHADFDRSQDLDEGEIHVWQQTAHESYTHKTKVLNELEKMKPLTLPPNAQLIEVNILDTNKDDTISLEEVQAGLQRLLRHGSKKEDYSNNVLAEFHAADDDGNGLNKAETDTWKLLLENNGLCQIINNPTFLVDELSKIPGFIHGLPPVTLLTSLDINGNGLMDVNELKTALNIGNIVDRRLREAVLLTFAHADLDESGELSRNELSSWGIDSDKLNEKAVIQDHEIVPEHFDSNHDGKITSDEIEYAMMSIGIPFSKKLSSNIIQKCDTQKSGFLTDRNIYDCNSYLKKLISKIHKSKSTTMKNIENKFQEHSRMASTKSPVNIPTNALKSAVIPLIPSTNMQPYEQPNFPVYHVDAIDGEEQRNMPHIYSPSATHPHLAFNHPPIHSGGINSHTHQNIPSGTNNLAFNYHPITPPSGMNSPTHPTIPSAIHTHNSNAPTISPNEMQIMNELPLMDDQMEEMQRKFIERTRESDKNFIMFDNDLPSIYHFNEVDSNSDKFVSLDELNAFNSKNRKQNFGQDLSTIAFHASDTDKDGLLSRVEFKKGGTRGHGKSVILNDKKIESLDIMGMIASLLSKDGNSSDEPPVSLKDADINPRIKQVLLDLEESISPQTIPSEKYVIPIVNNKTIKTESQHTIPSELRINDTYVSQIDDDLNGKLSRKEFSNYFESQPLASSSRKDEFEKFDKSDKDQDGELDTEEINLYNQISSHEDYSDFINVPHFKNNNNPEEYQQDFQTLDLNADGKLSLLELKTTFNNLKKENLVVIMNRCDHNRNNFIEYIEFACAIADTDEHPHDTIFIRIDINKDGTISKKEYVEFLKQHVKTIRMPSIYWRGLYMNTMDTNKDGKVSELEFRNHQIVPALSPHFMNEERYRSHDRSNAGSWDWKDVVHFVKFALGPSYSKQQKKLVINHILKFDLDKNKKVSYNELMSSLGDAIQINFPLSNSENKRSIDTNNEMKHDYNNIISMDLNGDSNVTIKEFEQRRSNIMPDVRFSDLDTDEDGVLSLEELKNTKIEEQHSINHFQLEAMPDIAHISSSSSDAFYVTEFKNLDKNADGVLNRKELDRNHEFVLDFDSNHDNVVSLKEYVSSFSGSALDKKNRLRFAVWDKDNNGSVSRLEYSIAHPQLEGSAVHFILLDGDQNGNLSYQEVFESNSSFKAKPQQANHTSHYVNGRHNPQYVESNDEILEHDENFDKMDTNHDGYLDVSELQDTPHTDLLDHVDFDTNGKLDRTEYLFSFSRSFVRSRDFDSFRKIDRNKDHKITLAEWLKVNTFFDSNNVFLRADTNSDGILSFTELYDNKTAIKSNNNTEEHKINYISQFDGMSPVGEFDKLDVNHNGGIDPIEFSKCKDCDTHPFGRVDVDNNGLVTWGEFERAFNSIEEKQRCRVEFALLDVNRDHFVDRSELILQNPLLNRTESSVDAIKMIDSDHDGRLSFEEMYGGARFMNSYTARVHNHAKKN